MGFDIGSLGMSLGESLFNGIAGLFGQKVANDQARQNFDYQWNKAYSPQAQVRNLTAAGINPAVAFGNNSPVFTGSGQFAIPENPLGGVFSHNLSDYANLYNAKANAKRAGAETKNLDIDSKAKEYELELSKFFSAPAKVAEITLAWKNVMLANDEHNIKEWQKVKEEMLAGLSGVQKQAAEKEFANMDTVIDQQNRQREEDIKLTQEKQKTEGTQQTANRAAAKNQLSQSEYYREYARLQRTFADIEESGKSFKLESLIKHYRASGKLDDASYEKAKKLYKNLLAINKDNDEHSWNQAADDLFYYLGEKIHQISPIGSMLDIDYSKK